MKLLKFTILLLLSQAVFSQNEDKLLIQNFYECCEAGDSKAYESVKAGKELFGAKQYYRSLKKFSKALKKDPDYCDVWYLVGYCHQRIGYYDKSIEACDQSLKINQDNPSALLIKANTLFLMNDTLTAIELFRKVKEIIPDKIDAYYGLALMLHLKGKNEDAASTLLEMEKNNVETKDFRDNRKIKNLKKKLNLLE
jgi:tetratricopeptide (TPR) repeat protein